MCYKKRKTWPTYTQIHLHLIFAVQNRRSLIQNSWKDRLYGYITGIVQQHKHKLKRTPASGAPSII
ncbi:MAG: transposase [Chitinophagaceae bacterium]|nr:transposase [Chitinophagaceae bacterium]